MSDRTEELLEAIVSTLALQTDILRELAQSVLRATMAVMDLRVEVSDVQQPAPPPDPPEPLREVPKNVRKFEGRSQFMPDAEFDIYRYELQGKHWLKCKVRKDGTLDAMTIEAPGRDPMPITPEEVLETFGVLPFNMIPMPGAHPTDAALNPDVEVAGE